MNAAVLEVKDLSVSFSTEAGHAQIVDGISFSISAGQATGLVGESGCGKSMAAMAILGLLPDNGTSVKSAGIALNGREISALTSAQRRKILGREIGMIFQQPGTALDPVFTLGQQLSAVYRRHAATVHDRHGHYLQAGGTNRRRTNHGPGQYDQCVDFAAIETSANSEPDCNLVDQPRPEYYQAML